MGNFLGVYDWDDELDEVLVRIYPVQTLRDRMNMAVAARIRRAFEVCR